MAKDPALLWYPSDYLSGTMYLDFECKGAYMDLLMLQFQKDKLTLHMIQHVLGHKFEHIWTHISDKFKTDGTFFWNERVKVEKEKRVTYCESRRSNKKGGSHMIQHMENENVNRNTIVVVKGGLGGKLKGEKFSEDFQFVFFPDGSKQKLGNEQKILAENKDIIPATIIQGSVY